MWPVKSISSSNVIPAESFPVDLKLSAYTVPLADMSPEAVILPST